jgi:hypothetical protein
MTFIKMSLIITRNQTRHEVKQHSSLDKLSYANNFSMLSVTLVNVILLSVVMLRVIIPNDIALNVIMHLVQKSI